MFKKIIKTLIISGIISPPVFATQVVVAPNLMVVVGTSNTMNQAFNGTTPQPVNGTNIFNDASFYPAGTNTLGTKLSGRYGNAPADAPTSKLYIAKQTLATLLNDPASSSINFGFATYKMMYGVLAYSTPGRWHNGGAFNLLPSDPNEWNKSITQQTNDAGSLSNFAAVLGTNQIFNNHSSPDNAAQRFSNNQSCQGIATNRLLPPAHTTYLGYSVIGQNFCDGGLGVIQDSHASYTQSVYNGQAGNGWDNSRHGGIPLVLQADQYNTNLHPIQNGQSSWYNALTGNQGWLNPAFLCQLDSSNCYQSQLQLSVNIGNPALTESNQPYTYLPSTPSSPLKYYLCQTGAIYNPEQESFVAKYISDGWVVSPYFSPNGAVSKIPNSNGVLPDSNGHYVQSSLTGVTCGNPQTAQLMPARTIESPDGLTVNLSQGQFAQWSQPTTIVGGSNWKQYGGQFRYPQNVNGHQAFVVSAGAYSIMDAPNYGNVYNNGPFAGQAFEIGNEDGWSGETQYHCVYNNHAPADLIGKPAYNQCASLASNSPLSNDVSEQLTVNYPSGVSNPDAPWRKLVSTNFIAEGAPAIYPDLPKPQHMGAFVDLPIPSSGYTDNRSTIAGLLGTTEMRDDGSDYNPNTQTMAPVVAGTTLAQTDSPNYGISADSLGPGTTSALYDSINDAYGYYSSYVTQDPYKQCRNNNLLLLVDGKETARAWRGANGQTIYADPTIIANKLYNDLGVHTYVVMMSSLQADIAQAQAIASSGHGLAFTANNASSLLNSLRAIIAGLGGTINATAVAAPLSLAANGAVYSEINSNLPSAINGDIQAFLVDAQGRPASTAAWSAENLENLADRTNLLYTTGPVANNVPGHLELFSSMVNNGDTQVFNSSNPTPSDIVAYTINPSYAGGRYLAGREPNSWLGLINNEQPAVLLNPPNNLSYVSDPTYVAFVQAETNRPTQLLFASKDGFLYSIYQNGTIINGSNVSGKLAWGFMPRDFLPNLQNYATFYSQPYGNSWFTLADGKTNGAWASYVVGTMDSGAANFAIKLNANGTPSSVTYEDYRAAGGLANAGAPLIVTDNNLNAYAVYLVNAAQTSPTVAGNPKLVVRELSNGSEPFAETSLPFTPASNLYFQNGAVYLGDNSGNVWQATLTTDNGILVPRLTNIGSIGDTGSISYVGGYTSNTGQISLFAASSSRVTVFQAQTTNVNSNLTPAWTSYVGGAGSWLNGVYTASTAGQVLPGTAAPTNGIQFLPTNGTITGSPAVVNSSLLVPVTITNQANACSSGSANMYLFSLDTGNFPNNTFNNIPPTGVAQPITGNITIGEGTAYAASTALVDSTMDLYLTAAQNQLPSGQMGPGAGSNMLLTTNAPVNRLVWWKILPN